MMENSKIIKYPRKSFIRYLLRLLGRLLVPILFNIEISGRDGFPQNGPLIVVGNHTAIMETVLLICYAPWQIEMLGAGDIPHERISQIFSDLFGYIPINRGNVDRSGLRLALGVLKQNGVLGIFPEGGIWEPGLMKAQTGVSWLSYRGKAQVLPIGFSGTLGALDKVLRLKKPRIVMKIGEIIPQIQVHAGIPRKKTFENYAEQVMSKVRELLLPDEPSIQEKITNERFELEVSVLRDDEEVKFPKDLIITHDKALAKFLHRPAILKIFRSNLKLPTDSLEQLKSERDPQKICDSTKYILDYLGKENPNFLSYRFGPKLGERMVLGLEELYKLSEWAAKSELNLLITPIRYFFSLEEEQEIIQKEQGYFKGWM
jgi:1-acyl-sn-glycerol-3-phosphate acyltransferase